MRTRTSASRALSDRSSRCGAQKLWGDSAASSRVLPVCGRARNDGTCQGEMSKTWRLTELARQVVGAAGMQADVLDLSLVTSVNAV